MKEAIECVLPDGLERMETGPIRFDDDYVGVFFRGDDAVAFGVALSIFLGSERSEEMSWLERPILASLASDLISCDESGSAELFLTSDNLSVMLKEEVE